MTLKLNKFNPKIIEEKRLTYGTVSCAFIGRKGCGKSTLVSDILYHVRKIPTGVVISGTEEGNGFYSKYVPDLFIHTKYTPQLLEKLIARQKLNIIKSKKDERNKLNNDVFLLLDDCMYDKAMVKDPNLRGVFMNGRWWRIMCLLTAQYCMDIPPDLRGNIDYLFILKENIVENQHKLYKHFFGMFPTFDTFRTVLISCTEGYDCLVLDNTSRSNAVENSVFWYRANPERKFRIGSKELWDFHKKNYNKKYVTDQLKTPKDKEENKKITNVSKISTKVTKLN